MKNLFKFLPVILICFVFVLFPLHNVFAGNSGGGKGPDGNGPPGNTGPGNQGNDRNNGNAGGDDGGPGDGDGPGGGGGDGDGSDLGASPSTSEGIGNYPSGCKTDWQRATLERCKGLSYTPFTNAAVVPE